MGRMHADEHAIDTALVRRLLRGQFPHWAGLPLVPLASGGTVNAVYRLGDTRTVRLPLTAGGAADVAKERRVLAALSGLPVETPVGAAVGETAGGYPWPWAGAGWARRGPGGGGPGAPG